MNNFLRMGLYFKCEILYAFSKQACTISKEKKKRKCKQ